MNKEKNKHFWTKAWEENSYKNKTFWVMAWVVFFLGAFLASIIFPIVYFKLKKKDPSKKPLTAEGKKMNYITYAILFLTLFIWFFTVVMSSMYVIEPETYETYSECLTKLDATTCNEAEYVWCKESILEETEIELCESYKECLEIYQKEEYCFNQYFEYSE